MPYVLRRGTIYGQPHVVGDFLPGSKGSLADMEEIGVVEWVETKKAPVAAPKAAPEAPAVKAAPTAKKSPRERVRRVSK